MWQTIGFERIKQQFEQLITNNGFGHAYLFSGQEMIGKKTLALELARLLGVNEVAFFDGAGGITIDAVRSIKRFSNLKATGTQPKLVILDNAHHLRNDSANALLKVLEEPAADSLLILISAYPKLLPATILSRCQIILFPPHTHAQIVEHLQSIGLSQPQADWLAQFSNGQIGWAISLQQRDDLIKIRTYLEQFDQLAKASIDERLAFAEKFFTGKKNTSEEGEWSPGRQVAERLLYWLFYLRSPLAKKLKIDKIKVLRDLLSTRQYLLSPQYNHRLVFENFLLGI